MAKKDVQEPDTALIDRLKAENDAQRAQNDQILDYLAELKEEVATLKAGQGAPAVPVPSKEAELDAELEKLKAEFADVPNIELFERRVVYGTEADSGIRLKAAPGGIPEPLVSEDPTGDRCYWKLRWFNFAIPGRADKFVKEGYLKVDRTELQDPETIPDLAMTDQYVRKGERGMEVLGKIPRKLFDYKKKRDAWRAGRMLQSESGIREHVSNHVASMAGATGGNADQAGSTVHRQFDVTITKGERETHTA